MYGANFCTEFKILKLLNKIYVPHTNPKWVLTLIMHIKKLSLRELFNGAPDGIVLLSGIKRVFSWQLQLFLNFVVKLSPSATSRSNLKWVLILIMRIKKLSLREFFKWGARWDSNPCISEPQSEVLTTWRQAPSLYLNNNIKIFFVYIFLWKKFELRPFRVGLRDSNS